MIASPEAESIRAKIPATASLTYLNTGWQGPSPRSVIAAVRETFDMEAEAPTAPPSNEKRLEIFRDVRRAVAGLLAAVEFVQGIGLEAVRGRALDLARYATGRLARVPDIRLVSPSSEEAMTEL